MSHGALNAGDRRVLREARTEAVVAVALDVALLAGLAVADKAKGWGIIDLPWWAWLLLAAPALALMTLLLAAPLAELSPGRMRNAGIVLLGLLVVSDVVAVGCARRRARDRAARTASAPETCSRTGRSSG